MKGTGVFIMGVMSIVFSLTIAHASQFHVSPDGRSVGDGSASKPWDLQTALNHPARVHAGDTIWVHGGTYHGTFASHLLGTAQSPIVVRNYGNERVTIDAGVAPAYRGIEVLQGGNWVLSSDSARMNSPVLEITHGGYVWFWGLELMSSNAERDAHLYTSGSDSWPVGLKEPYGLTVNGVAGVKIINCTIHDLGQNGITSYDQNRGVEYYGVIQWNNGFSYNIPSSVTWRYANPPTAGQSVSAGSSGTRHGHGMYAQNLGGGEQSGPSVNPMLVRDNIIMWPMENAVQAYGSRNSHVNDITFDGTIVTSGTYFLLGRGASVAYRNRVTNCIIGGALGYFDLGYTLEGGSLSHSNISNNIIFPWRINWGSPYTSDTSAGNYFVHSGGGIQSGLSVQFPRNTHGSFPASARDTVIIRQNAYEPKRAHIVVINPSGASTKSVDLSSILSVGDAYTIVDAQNYYGTPVATGTYSGGSISLQVTNTSISPYIGTTNARGDNIGSRRVHTGSTFQTFVLIGPKVAARLPRGSFDGFPGVLGVGGGSVTFVWTSTDAQSAGIDQGIGAVPVNGSLQVTVTRSAIYTLTLSNTAGSQTYVAEVVVANPQGQGEQDVTASGMPVAEVGNPVGCGNRDIEVIRDGVVPSPESTDSLAQYDTYNPAVPRTFDWVGYQFPDAHAFNHIVFQEGIHYAGGGFFASLRVQVRAEGVWEDVQNVVCDPPYQGLAGTNFQTYDISFAAVSGDGIRVAGELIGDSSFVSIAELRVFDVGTSDVGNQELPRATGLFQNYPNPFNPTTKIKYTLEQRSDVSLTVYSLPGQEVAILVNGLQDAGTHTAEFDASRLATGVYMYALKTGATHEIRKMVFMK